MFRWSLHSANGKEITEVDEVVEDNKKEEKVIKTVCVLFSVRCKSPFSIKKKLTGRLHTFLFKGCIIGL